MKTEIDYSILIWMSLIPGIVGLILYPLMNKLLKIKMNLHMYLFSGFICFVPIIGNIILLSCIAVLIKWFWLCLIYSKSNIIITKKINPWKY